MRVLVTGGTGTTGRGVADLLRRSGHEARTASRSGADVAFDWASPQSHEDAVRGAEAVYLVAPVGAGEPLPLVEAFLARARRAGVRRVVLVSASSIRPGEPGLGELAGAVSARAPQWAVLRPTWFASNFTGDHFHARRIAEHDEVVSATGEGRVPFIDPADIAEVAVRALTDPTPWQRDVVLTGPQPLSFDDVARVLSEVAGRSIRHRGVDADELARLLQDDGMPSAFAGVLAAMDLPIAAGAEDRTTGEVELVTGRPPRSFEAFATARAHLVRAVRA